LLSSSSAIFNSYSLLALVSRAPRGPLFSLLFSDFARFPPTTSLTALLVAPGETTADETLELRSLAPFFVLAYKEVISPFLSLNPASREKPGVTPSFGKCYSRILIGTFLI